MLQLSSCYISQYRSISKYYLVILLLQLVAEYHNTNWFKNIMPQLSTCIVVKHHSTGWYPILLSNITVLLQLQYSLLLNSIVYCTQHKTAWNSWNSFFFPLCVEILQHYTGRTAAPKNVCRKFGDSNTGRRPHQSNRFFWALRGNHISEWAISFSMIRPVSKKLFYFRHKFL